MIGLEGATCNTALIPEMEEIGANILLAEHIGRALVVGSEPADRLDVDVPGPLGKAGKPHVVDHTLTQRGHGRSPFGFKRQDLCPGTDQIPQHAVLNDYAFYGEAVQSNPRPHTQPKPSGGSIMSDEHSSTYIRAVACRVLLSLKRKAMGIEAISVDGKSFVLELAGDGPAILKNRIEELFQKHPEMYSWKLPPQH